MHTKLYVSAAHLVEFYFTNSFFFSLEKFKENRKYFSTSCYTLTAIFKSHKKNKLLYVFYK